MLYDYIFINIYFGPTEANLTIPLLCNGFHATFSMKLSFIVLGTEGEKSRDMVASPKHIRVGFDSF